MMMKLRLGAMQFLALKFLIKICSQPGVLTFQVPVEVAHEDVDNKCLNDKEEQCSPVSVMDFPSDNDTSMDDEDDDSSTFHNRHVHVEERKLMHKTRRFESVPQLEPVRFDDRIAQSESSTQTCLEHAQEDDQVEKKAMTLLQLTKSTVSSHHFMKHESVESLLLAFFKEKMINEHVSDSEMLHVAKDLMDEHKIFLDWGCEDDKRTCIREMEKTTTLDDDKIAPRRNAVLSFKVLDTNLLTTRKMDDEDSPGLKAVLTFQVPDEVAHEDVNNKCLNDKEEQCSPVSVMDFLSYSDTSMDDEDDDSSTFHNRHVHVAVDDDEIVPRRNAVLSFKVPDKNLLTTRTMDDEDAPGLKAVLTFHVPDGVAHEDVDVS
ncbi:hypothetical protein Tco_1302747 [Tanacetum coccineum]